MMGRKRRFPSHEQCTKRIREALQTEDLASYLEKQEHLGAEVESTLRHLFRNKNADTEFASLHLDQRDLDGCTLLERIGRVISASFNLPAKKREETEPLVGRLCESFLPCFDRFVPDTRLGSPDDDDNALTWMLRLFTWPTSSPLDLWFLKLVACGCDMKHRNASGKSVVDLALTHGGVNVLELLVEAGISLDATTDGVGNLPLHILATQDRSCELQSIFYRQRTGLELQLGVRNHAGKTPRDVAKSHGCRNMERMLGCMEQQMRRHTLPFYKAALIAACNMCRDTAHITVQYLVGDELSS